MVERALWGRRHMGSTTSHQGACGRHGGEERQRPREAWYGPSGRYGRNRATLADERARNRQRKARPEAPDGRGGYKRKRNSDRSGARSRIGARYSGTGSEQKAPDRRRTSGDAGRIQKVDRRGKAPCCVAASTRDERVSTWRKCGQVRNAKDPAPASRRPASRPETLGDHHPPSTETITQESGWRKTRTSRLSERTEEGRQPDLLRLYTQERGQSKRPRIAAGRAATPVGSKRPTGGGRPRAVWQRRRATRG